MSTPCIHGLIMAAGAAKRFGGKKQIAKYHHKTVIEHACDKLNLVLPNKVHVALGAFADEISPHVPSYANIHMVEKWQDGLGHSIASAVKLIHKQYQPEAILITLCDQVKITSKEYAQFVEAFNEADIICSKYNDKKGVPALFPRKYFDHLQALSGDQGAKDILMRINQNIYTIPLESALIDIDTKEDLTKLNNSK